MSQIFEGGCRCGAVRYCLTADKLPNVYACHCRDCQTWSGSAFSLQAIMPETALDVTGEPAIYERTNDSGRVTRQRGCPICFTRVFNTNSSRPGSVTLRAGSLDRSDELKIVAHIWTTRKMTGIVIPDGVPSWPETPPPTEFVAALIRA